MDQSYLRSIDSIVSNVSAMTLENKNMVSQGGQVKKLLSAYMNLREMLRETLLSSLGGWEEVQKIILHFTPFQNRNQIIEAIVNQILLKELGYK